MSPKRIINMAMGKGLDIIGICDHNSAENVQATIKAARDSKIKVLPGMEAATVEEIHIIALFDKIDGVLKLQKTIYEHLTPGENKKEVFGEQIIVNEYDEVEGYNRRLLISVTNLSVETLVNEIHKLGGIAIASHVDRESYSIIGQLGFIPRRLGLEAVEISPKMTIEQATDKFPEIADLAKIKASDAHFLQDVGKSTTLFLLEEPTIAEIRMALRNKKGRKVITEA